MVCATLISTHAAVAARGALARVDFAKMSEALIAQMKGLGAIL